MRQLTNENESDFMNETKICESSEWVNEAWVEQGETQRSETSSFKCNVKPQSREIASLMHFVHLHRCSSLSSMSDVQPLDSRLLLFAYIFSSARSPFEEFIVGVCTSSGIAAAWKCMIFCY